MRVRLKRKRLAKLLTQRQVSQNRWAQILGLSRGHLSDLLGGRHVYPSARTRRKLLEKLEVPFEELFEVEHSPKPDSTPPATTHGQLDSVVRGISRIFLLQDLRDGFRSLRTAPAFALAVILTIAVGVAANATMFSVVDQLLLRTLPFPESEQILILSRQGAREADISIPDAEDLRKRARSLEALAAFIPSRQFDLILEEPTLVQAALVEPEFFEVLRASPLEGRFLLPEDNRPGSQPVAVISESFKERYFPGDVAITGKTLSLSDRTVVVAGVAPQSVDLLQLGTEIWMALNPNAPSMADQRGTNNMEVIARLREGASVEQAAREVRQISQRLAATYPETNRSKILTATRARDFRVAPVRPALILMMGAVALVLLIACVNLASLFLVRAIGRRGEMAIRLALGGGSWRLLTHWISESTALSLLGGGLGVLAAAWGIRVIGQLIPAQFGMSTALSMNWRMVGFSLAACALTALLVGVFPALYSHRTSPSEVLRSDSNRATGDRGSRRWLTGFVVAEVALAFFLLVGAGLLIRTLVNLQAVELGFDPTNRWIVNLVLPESRYAEMSAQTRAFGSILESLESRPSIDQAAFTIGAPLAAFGAIGANVVLGDRPLSEPAEMASARNRPVLGNYFEVLQIPLLQGRGIQPSDTASSQAVAVVNQAFSRLHWPDQDPIGRRVAWKHGDDLHWMTVVGLVADVKSFGLDIPDSETLYTSYLQRQQPWQRFGTLVVQGRGKEEAVVTAIREAIWSVDPKLSIAEVTALGDRVIEVQWRERFLTRLLSLFAVAALFLALQGIYAVLSYAVRRRLSELGIRIALGATRGQVIKIVMRKALLMGTAGIVVGALLASYLGRLLENQLFGVAALDPLTFAAVAVLMLSVCLVACFLPAWRAGEVDPVLVLKRPAAR